jgi:hypothetical protein
MIFATPIRYGIYDSEPYRRRLGIAVFISLSIHALILSLEFGIPGAGLPGLQARWGEYRIQDQNLHIRLAEVNKSASAIAEAATATESASAAESLKQNSASDVGALQAPNEIPPAQATGNSRALPSSRSAKSSPLVILPDQENGPPISAAPSTSTPRVASTKAVAKQRKARTNSAKRERRNTALAKRSTVRPSQARNKQNIAAEPSTQNDFFAIAPAPETIPERSENETPAIQETAEDRQPVKLAEDLPNSEAPLVAEPNSPLQPEPVQAEMTPTPQATDPAVREALAAEQATHETQAQAEAAWQQEEEKARLAEELKTKNQAEENEKRQAMERERQRAEEEAGRLAEQEERRAREARQLAARELEEAAQQAEIEAQTQAELLARQQAAQGLEEEVRRRQELAARMKAEEEAKHAVAAEEQRRAELAAEEQRRAELAAKELAAEQMRAESERLAHESAMQAQQAAAARQAHQPSLDAQDSAQASAAQARAQAEEMIQRSRADQTISGESRGSSTPATPADAGGTGAGDRADMRDGEVPRPICPCFRCFKFKRSENDVPRTVCFCYRCGQKSRPPGKQR